MNVERDIVADYYSLCELGNIVDGAIRLKKDLYHSNSVRLLEALSFTYRANFFLTLCTVIIIDGKRERLP